MKHELNIVNKHLNFPRVTLVPPLKSGFLLMSAEVDRKTSFWGESHRKKTLIKTSKSLIKQLSEDDTVLEATLFKASLFPPGRNGGYLEKLTKKVHDRYDVVLLIELKSIEDIDKIKQHPIYISIEKAFKELSSYYFVYKGENKRRMGSVNHRKSGVFLFNYFVASNRTQNLDIWEYTAGWFQDQTGLDNSTLLGPINNDDSEYSVINHCRWDSFMKILPSLIFKRTFKTYVLDNFEANDVAAIPILFKLA